MSDQMSSIIENIPEQTSGHQEPDVSSDVSDGSYTLLLALIVTCLVVFLMYHAYSCFCVNQETEPYINEQPRTDTQDEKTFDVDDEVSKLSQMQEQYLEKLQQARTGNN